MDSNISVDSNIFDLQLNCHHKSKLNFTVITSSQRCYLCAELLKKNSQFAQLLLRAVKNLNFVWIIGKVFSTQFYHNVSSVMSSSKWVDLCLF